MTATMPKPVQTRGLIAKIHIARKKFALDDAAYRALLLRVTDKSSCAEMSVPQLERVLAEFERFGFGSAKPKRAGRIAQADGDQARKIRALWLSLWNLGEVKDPSEEALEAFMRRMTKATKLQWITPRQADQIIRALYGWLERAGWERPDGDDPISWRWALIRAQLKKLGRTEQEWIDIEIFRMGACLRKGQE